MKNILITVFSTALILMGSCNRIHEEVVETWPDGSKQLVYEVQGRGDNKVKVGEKRFYENGQLQYEKHFTGKDETPTGEWNYYYMEGKKFAKGDFNTNHQFGSDWKLWDISGEEFFKEKYDSLCIIEFNELQTPATAIYHQGTEEAIFQFYSNCAVRSQGKMMNGSRQGKWIFYHSNGQPQTEATFVDGKEDGTYCVFRETGVPYYRGEFENGKRIGIWEFYDDQANLIATKDFGK